MLTALFGVLGSIQHAVYGFSTNRDALQAAENYFINQPNELQYSLTAVAACILSLAILLTNLLTRSYACYHWFDQRLPLTEDQYIALESGIEELPQAAVNKTYWAVTLPFVFFAGVETLNSWFGYSETFTDTFQPNHCDANWPYRIGGLFLSLFATFGHVVFTVNAAYGLRKS